MLSSLVGPRASIKLQPYENLLYLYPLSDFERLESTAPAGHTFGGNVTLALPKPREIKSLVVKLVTYYAMTIPGHPSESGVLAEFATELTLPPRLERGEHTYAWTLNIPRDSAPYERCAYGRVYNRLQAVAETSKGTLKTDIPLEVIVNPAPEGEMLALHETIEGYNDEVGPYHMTLSSEQVTVGGAVHFTLNLASVPADTYIHSVSAHITQSYSLRSRTKPGLTVTPAHHERPVFLLDHRTLWRHPEAPHPPPVEKPGQPSTVVRSNSTRPPGAEILAFVEQGDSLELSHVARMPDDDLLRATTQHPSKSPIRISHQVMLEMRFSAPTGPSTSAGGGNAVRALRAERPIVISSCRCMLDSVLLPSYDDAVGGILQDDGSGRRRRGPRFGCPGECVCGFTLEHLLLKQHARLLMAHEHSTAEGHAARSDDVFIDNKITRPSPVAACRRD